jgi:hypothetical protein
MTETIDNNNIENRVRSFIDNVKKNVQNELSDIFDEDEEQNSKPLYMKNTEVIQFGGSIVNTSNTINTQDRGDIVMNLREGRKRRTKERRRVRRVRKKSKSSTVVKDKDTSSYYTDRNDNVVDNTEQTKISETSEPTESLLINFSQDQDSRPNDENDDRANSDVDSDVPLPTIDSEDKNELGVASESVDSVDTDESVESSEPDLSDIITQYIDAMLLEYCPPDSTDPSDLSDPSDSDDQSENLENATISKCDIQEKNEIHNTCINSSPECTYYLSDTKDLNTEDILKLIMSADNDKKLQQQTVERLQEMVRMNEDLKAIIDLGPADKLWLGEKDKTLKNTDGTETTNTYPCLEVHESSVWALDALARTWYGQGREPILAHINQMVDTLESQPDYGLMKTKGFIPQYAAKVSEAADKLEDQVLHQYPNFSEEIEDYVKRMREAAEAMLHSHNSRE